jgi:Tfp pilus assembly protein PilE
MKLRSFDKFRGSTVIELMTVLFILSGIAALIIPNLQLAVSKAKFTGCISNIRNMATSLEQYRNESPDEKYPETLIAICPRFIQSIPTCPGANRDTYSTGYEVNADRSNFTLMCKGHNHAAIGLPADQPYFNHAAGGLK